MEDSMSYLFNNQVDFIDPAVDGFGRLRVTQPFTLFDSQHRYQMNEKWDTFGVTGGTAYHTLNESTIHMEVGVTAGSKISRETKRVFPYQPGKSLLVLNTFAMNSPKNGLLQRVGYFGLSGGATAGVPENGIYVEQDGLTLYMCLASQSLNTTTRVQQSSWNGDKFDGSGPSGRTIDVSKTNIFWIDIEWLGVGDVRTGFYVDGRPVVAHTFHNDNVHHTVYMTTAVLPIRYELENKTAQASGSTMHQICSSVISEGGYEGFSRKYNVTKAGATATSLATKGTEYPMVALRLNSSRLDSVIIPSNVSIVAEDAINNKAATVQWKILLNPSITGNTWTTHFNGNVDYNITATAISDGIEIMGGYVNSNSTLQLSSINNFNFQIGRTQLGVSDVLALVLIPTENSLSAYADFSWYELI
jgi:hypothetical protein